MSALTALCLAEEHTGELVAVKIALDSIGGAAARPFPRRETRGRILRTRTLMRGRSAVAVCGFLVAVALGASPATWAAPRCAKRVPYQGKPLYARPVELPPPSYALGPSFPPEVRAAFDEVVREGARLTGALAIAAAIADESGWYESAGDELFYWASVGKAFTATAVLELVEERKLRLDDPLARWFPTFPNARSITVDDLLVHTAGIYSANEDPEARKQPRYRTPDESLAIAARHGALFCPGENWRYSNTGYTLLGEILSRVEGKPYARVIEERIVRPLGLGRTRVVSPADRLEGIAPLRPKDGSAPILSPAWAGAAGSVVASAGDMIRFWHALLTGRLLPVAATARRFAHLYPMFDGGTYYGQGVMLYEGPGVLWLGHSGGTPGAKAVVAYSPADRAFVAVALATDGPAEAVANRLLERLRAVRAAPRP